MSFCGAKTPRAEAIKRHAPFGLGGSKIGRLSKSNRVRQLPYVPVRKVAKATVVDGDPHACIHHFDVIQVTFLHCLEMGYFGAHACEVVLNRSV